MCLTERNDKIISLRYNSWPGTCNKTTRNTHYLGCEIQILFLSTSVSLSNVTPLPSGLLCRCTVCRRRAAIAPIRRCWPAAATAAAAVRSSPIPRTSSGGAQCSRARLGANSWCRRAPTGACTAAHCSIRCPASRARCSLRRSSVSDGADMSVSMCVYVCVCSVAVTIRVCTLCMVCLSPMPPPFPSTPRHPFRFRTHITQTPYSVS